ncbi:MAG TPA: PD-(D/E)XK nuclease family protein [Stenomitos sp.]
MKRPQETPRVSQHSLGDYEACRRRFALKYKASRYWPGPQPADTDPDATGAIRTGQLFHRMVQQQAMGLDVTGVLAAEAEQLPKLAQLWRLFDASPHARPKGRVLTEAPLHFTFQGAPFMVRFDRLVTDGETWEILDWKTGKTSRAKLETSFQTRLYRFALAEAGAVYNQGQPISPERVRMTYWDVQRGRAEEFAYDRASCDADRAIFAGLARDVLEPFDETLADDPAFPRTLNRQVCATCPFDSYCHPVALAPTEPQAAQQLPLPLFTLDPEVS